jgi:DNA uptake protein ComE-like DNA-binding protein
VSSRPPDSGSVFQRFQRQGLNAWVLIPSWVFGFFTWVTFFTLGVRARRRDWILTGAAYAVFSALAFFAFGRPEVENDDTANTLLGFALMVAWIGGAIHAGITYWISLQGVAQPARAASGRRPARRRNAAPAPTSDDLGLGFGNPAADYLASSQPVATPPAGTAIEAPVEANTASQRTLTRRLPGVTPDLARRWIAERQRRGGFRDIDDLATALQLQPHEIVRLRPRLSFAEPGPGPKRRLLPGRGRVLDV